MRFTSSINHEPRAVTVRDCIRPPRRIWSRFGVFIRIQTPDYFQNLTGTSVSKVTSVVKFSSKSVHCVRRYEPNCGKMTYLALLKNHFLNSWIRIRKRMTFKIQSVFLVYRCICGKIFTKSCSVVLRKVANRQMPVNTMP